VAATVILEEQVRITGGSGVTVIVNEQLVCWPQLLVAVQMTTFVPIGKILPLTGEHVTAGAVQPPLDVLMYETTAPFELFAPTVMLDEQAKMMGGSRLTVIVNEQFVC